MTAEAIRGYFDAYVDAFGRRDAAAVAALWDFPATISTPEGTYVFDEPTFRINVEALCAFYDRQGMAEARKSVIAVQPMATDVAAVVTDDALYDEDGWLIAEWRHGYVLRESDGRIRAVTAIADGEIAAWAARGTPLGS